MLDSSKTLSRSLYCPDFHRRMVPSSLHDANRFRCGWHRKFVTRPLCILTACSSSPGRSKEESEGSTGTGKRVDERKRAAREANTG